jgi:hypothetical protein
MNMRSDAVLRGIRIRMRNRPQDGRHDKNFVSRQIELHARQIAAARHRTTIGNAALPRPAAALRVIDIETQQVCRKLDARFIVEPFANRLEAFDQEISVELRGVGDREIQILGKPIRLEEALLETGAALEYPRRAEHFVTSDSREQPPEYVVFFDHIGAKAKFTCQLQDLRAVDHRAAAFPAQLSGIHSRQRLTSLGQAMAGSSLMLPWVRRFRQASTSSA